jgi:spore germination protein (amino acid permease)
MSQKISNLQIILLVANFIFSAAVISLPQIIVQVAGQNAWIVPLLMFPISFLVIIIIFGKRKNADKLSKIFTIGNKSSLFEKVFIFFFIVFILLILVRDLRGLIDFVATVLLPTTPIDVLMVLSVLVISYMMMSGLEVIARVNTITFGLLVLIVLGLPFFLLNELEIGNIQPLPSLSTINDLMKAITLTFAWLGEMLLFLIIIANIHPAKEAKKAVIIGTGLGSILFCIIIILEVAVLGTKIVREATYPTYIMVQQINLTDFLDRLDPIIVVVWLPTIFIKVSYLLYALNHCISFLRKKDTTKFMFPAAFILGYISLLLFKNNMDHIHYSFYSWSTIGLLLEVVIIGLFFLVRRKFKENNEHNAGKST